MSKKPTHYAFIVAAAPEGTDRPPQMYHIATCWSHDDGYGFDLDLPPGLTVSGRIFARCVMETPQEG
jgi:hypothetical protein